MTKKIRADKLKNLAKVAEHLVRNPHATLEEIAEEEGIGTSTAKRAKDEVAKSGNKDETIGIIVLDAKERIKRVWKLVNLELDAIEKEYIDEDWKELKQRLNKEDIKFLKDYVKDDLQRVTVFGGDITDSWGWLKEVRSLLDDIIG